MEKFNSFIKNGKNCLKWIVLAFTIGCLGGIAGSLFHIAIEYVTHLRLSNKWIIYCLPAGGVLIALMYGIFKKYGKLNTDRVIRALRGEDEVPFILVNYDDAYTLKEGGCLADIVPTLIEIMGKEQPVEMTGKSLLIKK